MLITQATLANWQSSIHSSPSEWVLSKSQACMSSLISGCRTGLRESPQPCSTVLRSLLPHFFFSTLTEREKWHPHPLCHCSGGRLCDPLTKSHPDSLHHHVSLHWELSHQNKKGLVYIYNSANLPGPGVFNWHQLIWMSKHLKAKHFGFFVIISVYLSGFSKILN